MSDLQAPGSHSWRSLSACDCADFLVNVLNVDSKVVVQIVDDAISQPSSCGVRRRRPQPHEARLRAAICKQGTDSAALLQWQCVSTRKTDDPKATV